MSDNNENVVPLPAQDGVARYTDGFVNLLAGLGVPGRDKFASQTYAHNALTTVDLENAYRSDWIARKVVTIPAWDMTREWRSWMADPDQIELLETLEKKLFIQQKLQQALIKARLYGGAAILIGVDVGKPEEELDPEEVKQDALKFIHVVSKNQLRAGPIIHDISSKYFGQPEFYEAANEPASKSFEQQVEKSKATAAFSALQVKLHPSRVVKLIGMDTADQMLSDIWGDSVLQNVNDAIKMCGLVTGSLATLVAELKVDVIKIPELKSILSTRDGTNKMLARFSAANAAKSVVNTIMIDGNEEWQRIQASMAGVPEVIMAYMQTAAGAADIPATRFLGMSPAGLNATGESDIRNYYDRLAAEQETVLTPTMTVLDEVIIRSALGDRPPEVWYEWRSLWQLSDMEKADRALKKAQAYQIDVNAAQLPPTALANARANQLIEDAFYPGLEKALEDAALEGDTIEEQNAAPVVDPLMEAHQTLAKAGALPPGTPPPFGGGAPGGGGGFPPKKPFGGGGKPFVAAAGKTPLKVVVGGKDSIWDFNPRHEPAGTSKGGEFARAGGAGGGGTIGGKEHTPMSEAEFAALLAESRAKTAARAARVAEIVAAGKPVKMVSQSRDNYVALVGPDMSEPGRFRITRFDERGPFGHSTYNTFESAVEDALREGYEVTGYVPKKLKHDTVALFAAEKLLDKGKGTGNPCHEPGGSSTGGQFCSTALPVRGAEAQKAVDDMVDTLRETAEQTAGSLRERLVVMNRLTGEVIDDIRHELKLDVPSMTHVTTPESQFSSKNWFNEKGEYWPDNAILDFHTHPIDQSFSDGDWKVFSRHTIGEMKVISHKNEYTLTKTPEFLNKDWKERTPAVIQSIFNRHVDEISDAILKSGSVPDDFVDQVINGANVETAKELGVHYTIVSLPKRKTHDFNPRHEPAGSSKGGEFAKKSGGSLAPTGAKKKHPGSGYSEAAYLENGVIHTPNVEDAARALFEDRRVELEQPRQVSTLLRRLGDIAKAMVAGGYAEPRFDLCKVSIKGTNLFCTESKGIPRVQMPQLNRETTVQLLDGFIDSLRGAGYKVEDTTEFASHLRATQNELNGALVSRIGRAQANSGRRIIVSRENYILDGHHYWAAKVGWDAADNKLTDDLKMNVSRVDIGIIELLKRSRQFSGAAQKFEYRNRQRYGDFNVHHYPAGSSKGGQFAPTTGTTALGRLTEAERQRYDELKAKYDKHTQEERVEFLKLDKRMELEIAVNRISKDLGFDASKIDFVEGTREFEVNGILHKAAGDADVHLGADNRIRLYLDHLDPLGNLEGVNALVSHEIEHNKFQAALDAHGRELKAAMKEPGPAPDPNHEFMWGRRGGLDAVMKPDDSLRAPYDKKYPAYTAMHNAMFSPSTQDFAKGDGVSDYSAEYWMGWHKGNVTTHAAMHETLAEMAAHKYNEGVFPPHYGFSAFPYVRGKSRPGGGTLKTTTLSGPEVPMQTGATAGTVLWRKLYKAVDDIYKRERKRK